MLKKENRLGKITSSKGKNFSSPFFNVSISKEDNEERRVGFVVSKKVSKSAVRRNRTKRVLQRGARNLIEKIKIGQKIIIYSKKELDFSKKEEIETTLKEILKKAKILNT